MNWQHGRWASTAEKIYLDRLAARRRATGSSPPGTPGPALVNYCGHGGLNQLAQENLFNVADANGLSNGGQLPLMVMLTCVAGRFELPGFTSLGEALLLNGNGGIAGGLVPSGGGAACRLHASGRGVLQGRLPRAGDDASGQALVAAMKNYLQLGGKSYLLNVYNWLGDPALAFK